MVYIAALPKGAARRLEHRAGWALLRSGLIRQGFCGREETVEGLMARAQKGEHGKPCLPGGPQFSISHSRGLIACAIEREPVGLDIERVREFSPGMIERICTPGEQLLTGGDRGLLTQLWTCKESYMKLTGRGLSQGLHAAEFIRLGERPEMAGNSARFYSTAIEHAGQEFRLTLCSYVPGDFRTEWTDYSDL